MVVAAAVARHGGAEPRAGEEDEPVLEQHHDRFDHKTCASVQVRRVLQTTDDQVAAAAAAYYVSGLVYGIATDLVYIDR